MLRRWTPHLPSSCREKLVRLSHRCNCADRMSQPLCFCVSRGWIRWRAGGTALRCPNLDGMDNADAHQHTTPLWDTAAANNRTIEVQTE